MGIHAQVVILADDFDGVGKAANVATVAWDTENGVNSATTITAVNDGGGAANYFGVQDDELDVNASVWGATDGWNISFTFTLDAGTSSIDLSSFNLNANLTNNSGAYRNGSQVNDWTLSITGDGAFGTQTASNTSSHASPPTGGLAGTSIDLSSFGNLVQGETYTLDLGVRQVSGDNTYVSLDDISLSGTITPVPEPSSALLFFLGLAGLALLRRKD